MKLKIIGAITAFALITGFTLTAQAKKEDTIPATHMWIESYETMIFVYASSVEQCEMLTKQAAYLNSAQSVCFNKEKLLKEINCQKSTSKGREPTCR